MTDTQSSPWVFQNPCRIHFGEGTRAAMAPLVAGRRILAVVTRRGRAQMMVDSLLALPDGDVTWVDSVRPNPDLKETQAEIDRLQGE